VSPADAALRRKTLHLLAELRKGKAGAADELLPHVYEDLRARAQEMFRRRKPGGTLQPTALVHEAYLRLIHAEGVDWRDRAHFCAVAVRAMRQVLVDHFRRKKADKRGGDWRRVTLAQVGGEAPPPQLDFLELEEALSRLEALDARQAEVVSLRFFAGLTVDEVAEALDLSRTTVEGEWRSARAWLARELGAARDR